MRAASVLRLAGLLVVLTALSLSDEPSDPARAGPGVTIPKPIYHPEPEYPPEARSAGVQGTVVFEVVVNQSGGVVNPSVLSPLGFGLDEKAQEASEKWRFEPGRKDGKPVNVLATIEVNFRLPERYYDSKAEDRRVRFNVALAGPVRRRVGLLARGRRCRRTRRRECA
jgi:TonB family protein